MITLKEDKLSQKVKQRFSLKDNTLSAKPKDDPRDRIEIEVGDSKQPDFKPQFKLMRWDNECNISIRAKEHENATFEEVDGVFKYKTPDYEVHQYEKPEVSEDGGFEFEWVLPQKPVSNVLEATVQSKDVEFYYQGELTQEEIDEGAQRSENVVGSYAVYAVSPKTNYTDKKLYRVGKIGHIYRPKAIDANGQEVWCDLHIENGLLTVTVPQDFIDNALYPVLVDPTFGYTTAGSSSIGRADDVVFSHGGFDIPESGTLDSQSAYIANALTAHKMGAYDQSSPNYNLIAETAGFSGNFTGPDWSTLNYSGSPAASPGDIQIVIAVEGGTTFDHYYDDVGSGFGSANDSVTWTYNGFPDPITFNALSGTQRKYSIYATYTATASAALTGTVTASIDEDDITTGGKTIILTLTGDTWVASGATFEAQRQNIIDGIDSAQSETNGWDAQVKANQGVSGVVRTSDTVVTITLDAQASYDITAQETITATIPASALVTSSSAVVASPTFTVDPVSALSGTLTFLQSATDATDASTYTFSSQNLGTADAGRYIIVTIASRIAGVATTTIDSVTIGGVSATITRQQVNQATNTDIAGIAIAAVPTGTTGNIVVTFNSTMLRCVIAAYRVVTLNSVTAYDSDDSTANPPSVNLDIPDDGFAIGTANSGVSGGSFSWTGLTEDSDDVVEFLTASSASDTFVTGELGRTITGTPSSSTNQVGVFASWAFASAVVAVPDSLSLLGVS